jgi:hypothetical protein
LRHTCQYIIFLVYMDKNQKSGKFVSLKQEVKTNNLLFTQKSYKESAQSIEWSSNEPVKLNLNPNAQRGRK